MINLYLCVDNVESLSKKRFINHYYKNRKPVLVQQGAHNWPAINKWSEDYFIEKIGKAQVVLNQFEHIKKSISRVLLPKMEMQEAINTMRNNRDITKKYYILRDSIVNHHPELLHDIHQISFLDSHVFCSKDLWFGDGGNITPIHFDAADNCVVSIFGEKTFYLYPPQETHCLYPNNIITGGRFNFCQITSRFLFDRSKYPLAIKAKCYKVTIKPGDILYIPLGWWHEVHTHDQRAVTTTYFFNSRKYSCLLWYFLGYQSCRLHEIRDNEITQELLYFTNYSNCFDSAYKLLAIGQWWIAVVLVGAMLEQLICYTVNQNTYMFLFDAIQQYHNHPICADLMQLKNYPTWKKIIMDAMIEDNKKLDHYEIYGFIQEIQRFITSNIR